MKSSALPHNPWTAQLDLKKLPKRVRLDKDFAGKLPIDSQWIALQRELEGADDSGASPRPARKARATARPKAGPQAGH